LAEIEKSKVYDLLVSDPRDIQSLVAYSLYKRHKRSWAAQYRSENDQEPDATADTAFAKSCSTDDQLERYRRDALDLLMAFADQMIEEATPEIEMSAIQDRIAHISSFWRQLFSNTIVNVVTIVILLGLTLVAFFSGIDPIDAIKTIKENGG
jgi:hypothetical protein